MQDKTDNQQLTQQKINELSKQFLSRSVQLSYTEDTDSTKGATSTKSYNHFLDQFPEIVKKHEKLQNKSYFSSHSTDKKLKRRSSITAIPVLEEYQNEELEVVQEEEKQHHHLPHIKLLKDHQEFSNRIQQFVDRSENFNCDRVKSRTYSVDKLEQVVEVDEKDDEKTQNKNPITIEYLLDQNEFNFSTPQQIRRLSSKKISNIVQSQELIIQEDNEDEKGQLQQEKETKRRFVFSNKASPKYKMVDELEMNQQSAFNFQDSQIETIQEEKDDIKEKSKIQKQFSSTMGKLHKELTNIQVDEQMDQLSDNKGDSMCKIQEIDDALEDDNNQNQSDNIQIKEVDEEEQEDQQEQQCSLKLIQ